MNLLRNFLLLALILVPASIVQAREIWRFDKLASDDQIEYVNLLIDSVEAAIQPEQLAQVKRFFASKQAGETMSGMGQFELNLSLARVADLEAVEKNPKVRRLEVEEVMYVTLVVNGIALPKSFRPAAINFQPKRPSGTVVMTKAESYKALAQTQAWVGRTVPLDRELPTGPGTWNRGGFGLALFRSLAEGQAKAEANGEPGLKSINQGTSDSPTKSYGDIVHEAKQRVVCHQVPDAIGSMTPNGLDASMPTHGGGSTHIECN